VTTAKPPARYGAIWGARPGGFALPSPTGNTTDAGASGLRCVVGSAAVRINVDGRGASGSGPR
jgi:hypothetical protein